MQRGIRSAASPDRHRSHVRCLEFPQDIPYGQTRSYAEVAAAIDRPKAARAIDMACWKNPIPIFVPCHRVIGSNGGMIGFLGGLEMKETLLELERSHGVRWACAVKIE